MTTPIPFHALQVDVGIPDFRQEELIEAWRQAHYAAQAEAEIGKSWADPKDDDSHSSSRWLSTADWRGLEGVPAAGAKPHRARLELESMTLGLHASDGSAVASMALSGRTLAEAMQWISDTGEQELGARRQPARPAPDLPEHRIAEGEAFAPTGPAHLHLAELYDITARVLGQLRGVAPALEAPSCWPHHFDLASLATIATDEEGALTQSIGLGLTPPDSFEPSGYWYVSPWSRAGEKADPSSVPGLTAGEWRARESLPMAVLPLGAIHRGSEGSEQLARFMAEAWGGAQTLLGR